MSLDKEKWLAKVGCGSSRNCDNPPESKHACPYSVELYDDRSKKCTCCSECRSECAMDV